MSDSREHWGSRIGLILAMAGNAVGLGNFLRFPVQAAQNNGGTFMIPYFIAFLVLGIPLMWIEWAMGRYGGQFGTGTTPGIFQRLWKHPMAKYLGVFGIFLPLMIVVYYNYIESWTLAYSVFSITGKFAAINDFNQMKEFLNGFQGWAKNSYFSSILPAYIFFLITFALNVWVLLNGISGGIEKVAKIGMPLLFVFAIILAIKVLTLGNPVPSHPDYTSLNGLGFLWNPDFSGLFKPKVWLAAAGQIFFTLSLGVGAIQTYASYLSKNDDIALNGLTAASTNEFVEVVLGSSVAIPASVAFFGIEATKHIADGGAFNLGFAALPMVFNKMPLGNLYGSLWFILLFIAGITSSVALTQPAIAFLEDELGLDRKKAVLYVALFLFISVQPVIFLEGFLDEVDFWVGTFGLSLFALVEFIMFIWVFGIRKAWRELKRGAQIKIPRIYAWIMKYLTPIYLITLFTAFIINTILKGGTEVTSGMIFARIFLVLIFIVLLFLIHFAWKRKESIGGEVK